MRPKFAALKPLSPAPHVEHEGSLARYAPMPALLVATCGLAWLALSICFAHRPIDDAFITGHYAENLAHGHGWVWNVGSTPTNGTTAPLWALLLALAVLVHAPIVPAMQVLDAVSYALGGAAGCWLAYRVTGLLGAAVSLAAATAFAPLLIPCMGMETPLYAAIVLISLVLWEEGRPRAAFLLAGIAPLIHGEGILLLGIMCGAVLLERRAHLLRSALAPALLPLLGWEVFSLWQFHALLPNSYLAKQALGGRVGDEVTPARFLVQVWDRTSAAWIWCAALLGTAAGRRVSSIRILAAWLLAYIVFYSFIAQVTVRAWYIVPAWLVLPPLLGVGVALPFRATAGRLRMGSIGGSLAAACVVLGMLAAPPALRAAMANPTGGPDLYQSAVAYLNTHPSGLVAAAEIGIVGFYSKDRVVDIQGLVNPEVVPHLARRDYTWVLMHYRPRYIFFWTVPRAGQCFPDYECAIWATPWFQRRYHVVWRRPWNPNVDYVIVADDTPTARRVHA